MAHMTAKVAVAKAVYAIDKPYDYRVPRELEGRLRPGMRVLVPFGGGNRGSDGMVLALGEEQPGGGLKDVIAALDPEPVLNENALRLALWMRERYFCTVYDAVKAMLPAGLYYALRDGVALKQGVDREAAYEAAGDSPAARQLAEHRKYQSEAAVRSYQKMKAAAEAGDPEAIKRYEAHLAKRREDYHKKKEQQEAISA